MGMKRIFLLVAAFFLGYYADAQTSSRVHFADSLHMAYDFEQAKKVYVEILDAIDPVEDSLLSDSLREKVLLSENGRNMSQFVQTPVVITKRKFSLNDFFLFFPLEDASWRPVPNILDTLSCKFPVHALYAPDGAEKIYFSALGESGSRDIMMTELKDTVWSVPVVDSLLSTSVSDEIYPLLSSDGNTIYFASKGLYGAGGYDLYKSYWNEREQVWSAPENLGFPYSSPADDFMYMETEDDEYIMFASNRECGKDSVMVYVLHKEPYPVHIPVTDSNELLELARLDVPVEEVSEQTPVNIPDNDLTLKYGKKISEVKQLRDSIALSMYVLDEMRDEYILSNDPGIRISLTNRILELETALPNIQKLLDHANKELRDIEMEFIKEGVFLNMDFNESESPVQEESDELEYVFKQKHMGGDLKMKFIQPEEEFDYSFRIEEKPVFAEDQTIPAGIIYQIQLFSGGRKATDSELKGLCPVYEHRTQSGMYTYRVGLFQSYDEVEECVKIVRKSCFKDAYVVAFIDGEEVSVAEARENEHRE